MVPTRVHSRAGHEQRSLDKIRTLVPSRVDDRGRHEQRSMRLNEVFDNFRREIEGATNPWSSRLDRRFPRDTGMLIPYAMEEGGTISRTPLVDMIDRDRYNLRLEVPGIDKDKIQLNATGDSIEISGEQSEEEALRKKEIITSTMSVRTNPSIAASQFQKKYFLRRSEQE